MIERYIIADDLIFDNELGRWLALEEVRDQLNQYEENMAGIVEFFRLFDRLLDEKLPTQYGMEEE